MKNPLAKITCLLALAFVVASFASASASSNTPAASFANPASEKAFASHGDLSVRTSDAALVAIVTQGGSGPANQYRSSGCSTGCSNGCSIGCSSGCSSGCSVGCSSGCSYGCRY